MWGSSLRQRSARRSIVNPRAKQGQVGPHDRNMAGDSSPSQQHRMGRARDFQFGRCRLEPLATAGSAPATTAWPTTSVFPRSSFVDGERSPVDFSTIQGVNGCLGLFGVCHLDKAEPSGAAGVPVRDDLGRIDLAKLLKHPLQIAVGRVKRQVADVQLLSHVGPPTEKTRDPSKAHSGLLLSHENRFVDWCTRIR